MKKFAVIGQPIKHSLSPRIHSEFAKELGIDISYDAIEIAPKDFNSTTKQLLENGYDGLNVTLPLKELAYRLADEVSETGRETGAVNTLWKEKGKILADSTDGKGLLEDLLNNQISLKDSNLVILGAGGAALSILPSILSLHPQKVTILNRTLEKSCALVDKFKDRGVQLQAIPMKEAPEGSLTGVINTTSAEVTGEDLILNVSIFKKADWSYDLSYSKETTSFNQLAKDSGIEVCFDGLGMLVSQAAFSFKIWTGKQPPTNRVLSLIKSFL
jgi:shikimate dehydrogenase|tara:strand:+ start:120 stop:935 length:816 start_codon:yes stop_codon:yes gene_type:complete